MIKVAYYTNLWDYAGTARSHERIIEALNRKEFEPYVICWEKEYGMPLSRIKQIEEKIGKDHIVTIERPINITDCTDENTTFAAAIEKISPDIIHVARAGDPVWPMTRRYGCKVVVETNVFGRVDNTGRVDRTICISHYCAARRGTCDAIIYNMIPVSTPSQTYRNEFRQEFGIPNDSILCGRIGSDYGHAEFALRMFNLANTVLNNRLYYIIVNPDPRTRKQATGMRNVILLGATTDDLWIDKFYNSLDIFLHFRNNGEICGCAIQEAMMRGVPVISHITDQDNGQIEIVGSGGMIAVTDQEYIKSIIYMANNYKVRKMFGDNARAIALKQYAQDKLINAVEMCYKKWLS